MKTIKNILTENRNLIIAALNAAFANKDVTLATAMTDFLAFMEADPEWVDVLNNNGDDVTPFLKNAINVFAAQADYQLKLDLIEQLDDKRRETARRYYL